MANVEKIERVRGKKNLKSGTSLARCWISGLKTEVLT